MAWTSTLEGFRRDEFPAKAGCRGANWAVGESRSEKLLLLSKMKGQRGQKYCLTIR